MTKLLERLQETGERDRLKVYLRRLLQDSPWRNQVRQKCRQILKIHSSENKDKDDKGRIMSVERLVEQVEGFAKDVVPRQAHAKILVEVADCVRTYTRPL